MEVFCFMLASQGHLSCQSLNSGESPSQSMHSQVPNTYSMPGQNGPEWLEEKKWFMENRIAISPDDKSVCDLH